MRVVCLSVLVGAGLLMALAAGPIAGESVYEPAVRRTATRSDELITHFAAGEGRPHTLVVVDERQRTVGVLHIDATTGEITLKSVRNINWDLQMTDFNSNSPLPQDIRKGLER